MRSGATLRSAIQSVTPRPTVLLEMSTGITSAGDEYIRLTSDPQDRVWSGSTFTARPFEADGFTVESQTEGEVRITVSDTDGYWNTWLQSTDFRWQKVTRFMIDRSISAQTTQVIKDRWRVRSVARADREVSFTCEPVLAILSRVSSPQERITREEFPGVPAAGDLA